MSLPVVLMTTSCRLRATHRRCSTKGKKYHAHLASFIDKYQFYRIVSAFGDRRDLCRYPRLIFVFKPDSRSLAVDIFGHCQGLVGDCRELR
jgi:hypothetical protein